MGSNGLTSARHDVFNKTIADKYPEAYDAAIPYELIFSGSKNLTDKIDIGNNQSVTAGKLVLSATRTYAPISKKCSMLTAARYMAWYIAAAARKPRCCILLITCISSRITFSGTSAV
jgi:hypothetical protein